MAGASGALGASGFCLRSGATAGLTRLETCSGFLGTEVAPTACFSFGVSRSTLGAGVGGSADFLTTNFGGCGGAWTG